MSKHSVKLSVKLIIIAIIVLLVLVVLFVIFTERAWAPAPMPPDRVRSLCMDGSQPVSNPIPGESCVPVLGGSDGSKGWCCTSK